MTLAVTLAGTLGVGAQEQPPFGKGESFEQRTQFVGKTIKSIDGRIEEVAQLRARALKEGSAVKVSCIDDKLRKLRAALDAAKVIEGGWHLARLNEPFADRSMDRLRVLEILAVANADAAYACTDAHLAGIKMTTQVEVTVDVPVGATGASAVRPPVIERPPLASPY